MGLSDRELVRPVGKRRDAKNGVLTAMIIVIGMAVVALAMLFWQRQQPSPSRSRIHAARHYPAAAANKPRSPTASAVTAGEDTAPLDAAAEWDAAHPAPPDEEDGNE